MTLRTDVWLRRCYRDTPGIPDVLAWMLYTLYRTALPRIVGRRETVGDSVARPFNWDGGGISFGDPAPFGAYQGLTFDNPVTWGPFHAWVHWYNDGYPAQQIMNQRVVFGVAVTEDDIDGNPNPPDTPAADPTFDWVWVSVAWPYWTGHPSDGAASGVRFLPQEQVHANVFRRTTRPSRLWLSWSQQGVNPTFNVGFGFDFRVGLRLV